MTSSQKRILVFSLLTLVAVVAIDCSTAEAQESVKTAPFELAHPTSGEPGVWIPLWLQQVELQRKAKLHTCTTASIKQGETLAERTAEVGNVRAAKAALDKANTSLQTSLAGTNLKLEASQAELAVAKDTASDRLWWALGSTAAAGMAVLVLILGAI